MFNEYIKAVVSTLELTSVVQTILYFIQIFNSGRISLKHVTFTVEWPSYMRGDNESIFDLLYLKDVQCLSTPMVNHLTSFCKY